MRWVGCAPSGPGCFGHGSSEQSRPLRPPRLLRPARAPQPRLCVGRDGRAACVARLVPRFRQRPVRRGGLGLGWAACGARGFARAWRGGVGLPQPAQPAASRGLCGLCLAWPEVVLGGRLQRPRRAEAAEQATEAAAAKAVERRRANRPPRPRTRQHAGQPKPNPPRHPLVSPSVFKLSHRGEIMAVRFEVRACMGPLFAKTRAGWQLAWPVRRGCGRAWEEAGGGRTVASAGVAWLQSGNYVASALFAVWVGLRGRGGRRGGLSLRSPCAVWAACLRAPLGPHGLHGR